LDSEDWIPVTGNANHGITKLPINKRTNILTIHQLFSNAPIRIPHLPSIQRALPIFRDTLRT